MQVKVEGIEGVKLNLGSYHPINKLSVIWKSESQSDRETDTETAQGVVHL